MNYAKAKVKQKAIKSMNEELKRRRDSMFPNCIGLFPDDCVGVKKDWIGDSCKSCPYYSEVNYMAEIKQLKPEEYSEDRKRAMIETHGSWEEFLKVHNAKTKPTKQPKQPKDSSQVKQRIGSDVERVVIVCYICGKTCQKNVIWYNKEKQKNPNIDKEWAHRLCKKNK